MTKVLTNTEARAGTRPQAPCSGCLSSHSFLPLSQGSCSPWIGSTCPGAEAPWRGTHGMTQVRGYVGRLLATALLLAVAAMGAMAETPPSETSSFRNDVDAFAASVKMQTERVVAGVHRALERSTRKLVVFKARMRSKIETWRAEESRFMPLSGDAATTLNAWKTVAAQSWAQICVAAANMLEDIADRMHAPSETHATRP